MRISLCFYATHEQPPLACKLSESRLRSFHGEGIAVVGDAWAGK